MKIKSQNNLGYILFGLTLASFFFGFFLRENSAGGGIFDSIHEWDYHLLLKENLFNFLGPEYAASRFPFSLILNIIFNPFVKNQSDFIIFFFIYSFILIYFFYYGLKKILKIENTSKLLILTSILLLSPYFRTSSFWGLQENLSYIFLIITILLYEKNHKNNYGVILFAFLTYYTDQKFIFIPGIFFILLLNKEKAFSKDNIQLLFFSILLFLPSLIIFYFWGGLTNSNALGSNNQSFQPKNIIFAINIISIYLLPFILMNLKNINLTKTINKKKFPIILLFLVLYLFIKYFFINDDIKIGGGWAFKIFLFLNEKNLIISEIFLLTAYIFSFFLIILYFQILKKNFIKKIIIIYLIIFSCFAELVFQEYFDPLLLLLIFFIFQKNDLKLISFKKCIFLYSYFFIFLSGCISYYHFL